MSAQRSSGVAPLSRRRALSVIAGAAGVMLIPMARRSRSEPPIYRWRGVALGAEASLQLAHPDRNAAARAVDRCLDEIARLERIFSLHRPDSELCRLNRDGRLDRASHDLRLLLAEARRFGALSGGAFDVTVQPLWRLYAAHFAVHPEDTLGPPAARLEAARRLVDDRAIVLDGAGVRLLRPGMGVTLNGIAQGYITDRVADLLRDAGFASVLVQLGETVAGDPPSEGSPWRIGIPDPAAPDRLIETFDAVDLAIATSSGRATRFDAAGRHHHLFDPATGRSADRCASVTVLARRAATADALSTALAVLPLAAAPDLLRQAGATALHVAPDGSRRWLGA
jgi:thiamine biosynthesis lipoprotein